MHHFEGCLRYIVALLLEEIYQKMKLRPHEKMLTRTPYFSAQGAPITQPSQVNLSWTHRSVAIDNVSCGRRGDIP